MLTLIAAFLIVSACDENAPQHAESGDDKITAMLAANEITPAQIAQYLFARGWNIIPSDIPRPHWAPAPAGAYPISYYVCEVRAAIGDTSLAMYFPQTAGPYRMAVRAVDSHGNMGPWSEVGYSDNGDGSNALPGVRP